MCINVQWVRSIEVATVVEFGTQQTHHSLLTAEREKAASV